MAANDDPSSNTASLEQKIDVLISLTAYQVAQRIQAVAPIAWAR